MAKNQSSEFLGAIACGGDEEDKHEMRNKVIMGECLEVMRGLPDKSVDMILCDLPYGVTACKWDSVIPMEELWVEYRRLIKQIGSIVLFGTEPFSSHLRMAALDLYKYDWIWVKNCPTLPHHARNRPMSKHENISVFSNGSCNHKSLTPADKRMTYEPQGLSAPFDAIVERWDCMTHPLHHPRPNALGKKYLSNTGFPCSVLEYTKERGLHPTQKPVSLCEYMIRTYTQPGDLVLDNCAGSGTTAIAAMNCGRDYLLIEREQKYIETIQKRIAAHGVQATLDL